MKESIDSSPIKRLKTTHNQNLCSTFESLSNELILTLFEYFNTKEIIQSFFNLNSRLTSCIFGEHQQIHLHLDQQISSLSDNFSSNQIISLDLEDVVIPMGSFLNLKSLSIVIGNEQESECLNMINEIGKLSQLINFRLCLDSCEVTSASHQIIQTTLCHSSLQRIILSKHRHSVFDSDSMSSPLVKLLFPSAKRVYVAEDFPGVKNDRLHYKLASQIPLLFTPQYHVRHFDLEFKSWKIQSLVQCLSALPLLMTLKMKGSCCSCIPTYGWLSVHTWDQILQDLKALQRVNIDIAFGIPMRLRVKTSTSFNERVAQYTQTTKRINLRAAEKADSPYIRCVQLTALL